MRFGKGTSLSHVEGTSKRCDYSIRNIGNHVRLVVKCKGCENKASLLERKCRNRVLDILLKEPIPGSIVLSGFVETLYEDNAILLASRMTDILRNIRQSGRRQTDDGRCSNCKKSPKYVFTKIERAFSKSLAALYWEMKLQTSDFLPDRDSCEDCVESTRSDLDSLSKSMGELRSFVLKHAYRISSSSDEEVKMIWRRDSK